MITIGLDFGTHQSKVCIERREGAELGYEFFMFNDADGIERFTLPSIIRVDNQNRLSYGYLPKDKKKGKLIRYFKQATFTNANQRIDKMDAVYYSIWYIAYILFYIEERFGQDFAVQMGVPSDGQIFNDQKILAVRILLSAYRLVEDVFENDKDFFLQSTKQDLLDVTEFLPYSKEKKEGYNLLVFPEAYACLMPLVSSAKIATGMSLMVDIGGGTTDISFFTIENGRPQVYKYYSINKGLNYLTDADKYTDNDERQDTNVHDDSEIKYNRLGSFTIEIRGKCRQLRENLIKEFKSQSELPVERLTDALRARPIVYSGGGSTFRRLRNKYLGFNDIIPISEKEWHSEVMKDMDRIAALKLCPILSTAYGLSIGVTDDDIKCKPFRDIFEGIRKWEVEKSQRKSFVYGHSISSYGFDYGTDYDAFK